MKTMLSVVITITVFITALTFVPIDATKSNRLEAREFVNLNGTYYYFSPKGLYMEAHVAARFCGDVGMVMLSLENAEKEQMIVNHLRETGNDVSYWTSGAMYSGNKWIWTSTGQLIEEYTNWGPEQPNDYNRYDDICIYLRNETWDDVYCNSVCCVGVVCQEP